VNPRETSFHLYHVKLKGPVPPGLTAVRAPLTLPDELQKTKTGSLAEGELGYEIYLTALDPGADSCAVSATGKRRMTIVIQ
jgi:hypothetical protein